MSASSPWAGSPPAAGAAAPDAGGLAARYRQTARRRSLVLLALAAAILASLALDLCAGPAELSALDILRGLIDPEALPLRERVVLWSVRLPDALIALAVGGALGLAGVEAQTALNNPLASPFTLGVSAAATLGAALALVFGPMLPLVSSLPEAALVPIPALLCALGSGALVLIFARIFGADREIIVLFGVAQFFLCEALIALLQLVADAETVQEIVFWQVGNLSRAGWTELAIVAAALALAAPLSARQVWKMTLLRGGDEQAAALGVDVDRLRMETVLRLSVLTALAVCFVGAIGFVGLVGPHIARLLLGEDQRYLMPGAALSGMLLLSVASALSKTLLPGVVIPVGILTAVIGAPALMLLLATRRRAR